MSSSGGPITEKLDNLINSVSQKYNIELPKSKMEEKKDNNDNAPKPTKPEQSPDDYDLSKPYKIVVEDGNQGGPEKLKVKNFDLDSIKLAENQVLIDIHSSGVNFIDTYHRSGLYKNVLNIGKEGAGIIIKIGSAVDNYAEGDKVCWFSIQGSYATHIVTTNDNIGLMKIPESLFKQYESDEEVFDIGASIGIQALTAHYLCRSLYPVGNQSSVLIHAGAGGTGGILIQICKKILKSPLVITTVGSEEKKKIALGYGADKVILYKEENFVEKVMEYTKNQKVNVVFDGVGKTTYQGSLQCTAMRGMCVFFGNASGPVPPIDPLTLTKCGSVFITRPTLSHYISSPQELKFRYDELFAWMEKKEVNIKIGSRFNLSKVFDAHSSLEGRKTIGKIILKKDYKGDKNDTEKQMG